MALALAMVSCISVLVQRICVCIDSMYVSVVCCVCLLCFVLCYVVQRDFVEQLKRQTSGSMFSTAMSPIICKQIIRAFDIIDGSLFVACVCGVGIDVDRSESMTMNMRPKSTMSTRVLRVNDYDQKYHEYSSTPQTVNVSVVGLLCFSRLQSS